MSTPLTRPTAASALLVAAVLALVGCTADPAPADAPPTTSTASPGTVPDGPAPAPRTRPTPSADAAGRANLPDIPIRPTDLSTLDRTRTMPVGLAISSLGVELPIDPVGVQADGQMEIPPLAERAGWYRFGAAPGEPTGTAVVAAHVDSVASAGLGPFARLGEVRVGDVVDVTLADGSVAQYAVTGVSSVSKQQVTWPDVFTRDGAPRLVLITCGGTFQQESSQYSDNVIVTADPVGG